MIPFIIETDNFIGGRCMFFLYVILAIILVFAILTLIRHFLQKKYLNILKKDKIIKRYHKVQLIYIILAIILFIVISTLIIHFQQKKYLNVLTQDEFIKGYRKAQLIDIREPQEFERGYIRGARNLPLTQMKQRLVELRPDKPVYL